MIASLRLTNDAGGAAALSRMLAGSAEITEPAFRILLVEGRAYGPLIDRIFR
jgi:hypothetical protein